MPSCTQLGPEGIPLLLGRANKIHRMKRTTHLQRHRQTPSDTHKYHTTYTVFLRLRSRLSKKIMQRQDSAQVSGMYCRMRSSHETKYKQNDPSAAWLFHIAYIKSTSQNIFLGDRNHLSDDPPMNATIEINWCIQQLLFRLSHHALII